MFAAPFNRMFWMEYRAQRALLFSCLLIGIVTQITLGFTALHPEIRSDFLLGAASFFPVMCTVADISEGGAGLTFVNIASIPDQFELEIKGETKTRVCKVAWRAEPHRMGVAFVAV